MIYANRYLEPILEFNLKLPEYAKNNLKIHIFPERLGGHDYRGKVFFNNDDYFAEIEYNPNTMNDNNFVIKILDNPDNKEQKNATLCARFIMIAAYKELVDYIRTKSNRERKAIENKVNYVIRKYKIKGTDPNNYERGCLEAYYADFGHLPPNNPVFDL